jgi:DNA-binding transcriptional regulator YbjK
VSVTGRNSKEDKQFAVSTAILEVIEKDGLAGVTHSKVSRKSKVSRAWIYEYIGKDKGDLVEYAAEVFASHFARTKMMEFPKSRTELESRLKDGTDFLFTSVALSPVVIKIYFRFRGTDNRIGKVIQKYEKQWLGSASKTVVNIFQMSEEQATLLAELLLILRLGFAHRFATSLNSDESREHAKKIFSYIHSMAPIFLK